MATSDRPLISFSGFPDGQLRATVLPSMFITDVVGSIEDLAELKLALYLFWRFGQKRSATAYLTRRELEAESIVRDGLGGSIELGRALDRVVARQLVLRRRIELAGRVEECFFLNSASGRRTVKDLESGKIDLGQVVVPVESTGRADRPNIFQLYEQNVGMLTPLIAEELSEAERRYAGDWIEEAFRQAVAYNRRNWKYVQRILERWAIEGKGPEAGGSGASGSHSRRPNGASR